MKMKLRTRVILIIVLLLVVFVFCQLHSNLFKSSTSSESSTAKTVTSSSVPKTSSETTQPLVRKLVVVKVLIEDHPLPFPNPVASSIANARLALKYINGYVLRSGQIFSFNAVVGERLRSRGFVIGPLIRGYGYGGGVCKASTIIFQAARDAGLEIIEHHNHSKPVAYAKRGDEAAISWGSLDNVFRNNTSYDLLFECSLDSDSVGHVQIYNLVTVVVYE